jgi:glycosyltransferase involved in cell wall biosynthesis
MEKVLITVNLSTYNGDKYLKQQLDSLHKQTYTNFYIIARDDYSTDNSLKVLKSYDIEIMPQGKNLGPKGSFSALLEYSLLNDSQYFMFCDQDDVWKKEKIEKTLKKMKKLESKFGDIPLLIHTDLEVVDAGLNTIDNSFWNFEQINPNMNEFNKLLVQNTITGCTVMINRKLAELAMPIPNGAIMHDWWLGLVASKFGKIDFIDEALIKYRQHGDNSIGAKGFNTLSILSKFYKIFYKNELYLKHLKINIEQAKAFLESYRESLDKKTIEMLEEFSNLESKSFWQKRKIMLKYKLLKQGFIRNVGLLLKI